MIITPTSLTIKLTCIGLTSNMTDKKVFTANVGYQFRIAEHAQSPTESDETRHLLVKTTTFLQQKLQKNIRILTLIFLYFLHSNLLLYNITVCTLNHDYWHNLPKIRIAPRAKISDFLNLKNELIF